METITSTLPEHPACDSFLSLNYFSTGRGGLSLQAGPQDPGYWDSQVPVGHSNSEFKCDWNSGRFAGMPVGTTGVDARSDEVNVSDTRESDIAMTMGYHSRWMSSFLASTYSTADDLRSSGSPDIN